MRAACALTEMGAFMKLYRMPCTRHALTRRARHHAGRPHQAGPGSTWTLGGCSIPTYSACAAQTAPCKADHARMNQHPDRLQAHLPCGAMTYFLAKGHITAHKDKNPGSLGRTQGQPAQARLAPRSAILCHTHEGTNPALGTATAPVGRRVRSRRSRGAPGQRPPCGRSGEPAPRTAMAGQACPGCARPLRSPR